VPPRTVPLTCALLASAILLQPTAGMTPHNQSMTRSSTVACTSAPANMGSRAPGSFVDLSIRLGSSRTTLKAAVTASRWLRPLELMLTTRRGSSGNLTIHMPDTEVGELSSVSLTSPAMLVPPGSFVLCMADLNRVGVTALLPLVMHHAVSIMGFRIVDARLQQATLDVGFEDVAIGLAARNNSALVGSDTHFVGQFTDDAHSGSPVQIWNWRGSTFIPVTGQYPTYVGSNATIWWRAYVTAKKDPLGFLAAWAADQCVIGRCSYAFKRIASVGIKFPALDGTRTLNGYLNHLRSFLRQEGYIEPTQ
jgi:hypothetical protein